jgi:hypothetical protein
MYKEWTGEGLFDLNNFINTKIPLILFLDQIEHLEKKEIRIIRKYITAEKKNIFLITASSLNNSDTALHDMTTYVTDINFNDSFTDREFKFMMIKHQNYDEFFKKFFPIKFESQKGYVDEEWAGYIPNPFVNFQKNNEEENYIVPQFKLWASLEEIFNVTKKSPLLLTYLYLVGVKHDYDGRMDKLLNEFEKYLRMQYSETTIAKRIININSDITAQEVYEIVSSINEVGSSQQLIPSAYVDYFDKKFIMIEEFPEKKLVCENEYYLDYITSIIIKKIEQYNSTYEYFYKISQTKYEDKCRIISGKYFELAVRLRFKQQKSKFEYFSSVKFAEVYSYTDFDILMENLSENIKNGNSKLKEIIATSDENSHAIFIRNKLNEKFIDYMVISTDSVNRILNIHCNQITISPKHKNFMSEKDFYMKFMKLFKVCKELDYIFNMEFGWSFPEFPKKDEEYKNKYKSHKASLYFYYEKDNQIVRVDNDSDILPRIGLEDAFVVYEKDQKQRNKAIHEGSEKKKKAKNTNLQKNNPIANSNVTNEINVYSDMESFIEFNLGKTD